MNNHDKKNGPVILKSDILFEKKKNQMTSEQILCQAFKTNPCTVVCTGTEHTHVKLHETC